MAGGNDARRRAALLIEEARRSAQRHEDPRLEGLLSAAEAELTRAPDQRAGWVAVTGAVRRLVAMARDRHGAPGVTPGVAAGARPPWEQVQLGVIMLGAFRVYQDGAPVDPWRGARSQRLLRYLVARRPRPVPREQLIDLLWPDADPESGRRNLHQAVYTLRLALRARQPQLQHIVFEADCYGLDPRLEVWVDTEAFEELARDARRCEQAGHRGRARAAYRAADALYGGDYLEDTPFEEWAITERECLRARHTEVLHRLVDLHLELGDSDEAVACARRVLGTDPTDEVAHRGLMRAHVAQGRRGDAIQQYRQCAIALDREYGLRPGAETVALYESLEGGA